MNRPLVPPGWLLDEEEAEEVGADELLMRCSKRDKGIGDDCGDGLLVNVERFGVVVVVVVVAAPEELEEILMGEEFRLPVGVDHPVRRDGPLGGVPLNLERVVLEEFDEEET